MDVIPYLLQGKRANNFKKDKVIYRVMIQLHVSSYEDRNKCFCLDNVNFETPFIYSSGEDQ